MTLPNTAQSIEVLQAKTEAVDMVDGLIRRNMELEEVHQCIQPLLYALSMKLYGDNEETISLDKLIGDGIKFINGETK